ncbi:MAG: hypothetical protein ACYDCQ_14145 [Dehalococcoidia bacterium]
MRQLEAMWTAAGAQLVTLWGRRRVGKSTLLAQFATGKRVIYLYGTRIAERDILAGLALQAAAALDEPYLRSAPSPPRTRRSTTWRRGRGRSGCLSSSTSSRISVMCLRR